MECRIKWSQSRVKRVNTQWRQVVRATDPTTSQLERIGALVIADRVLEFLLEALNWSNDPVGRKIIALKGMIPDYTGFVRARDIRHNAVHEMVRIRHKRLLLALLEYQRVFEALGVPLEDKIQLETVQRNGARILQRYMS